MMIVVAISDKPHGARLYAKRMIVSIITILVGLATLPSINGAALHANYRRVRCQFNGNYLRVIAWMIWSEQGGVLPLVRTYGKNPYIGRVC